MKLSTYIKLDATEMAELIRKREITPSELLELKFRTTRQSKSVIEHRDRYPKRKSYGRSQAN